MPSPLWRAHRTAPPSYGLGRQKDGPCAASHLWIFEIKISHHRVLQVSPDNSDVATGTDERIDLAQLTAQRGGTPCGISTGDVNIAQVVV